MWKYQPALFHPYQIAINQRKQPRGTIAIVFIATIILSLVLLVGPAMHMGLMPLPLPYENDNNDKEAVSNDVPHTRTVMQRVVNQNDTFQMIQHKCRIPLAHINSEDYRKSFSKRLDPELEICETEDVAVLENNILNLKSESNCCVKKITRSMFDYRDWYTRSTECHNFINDKFDASKTEFIQVICNEHQNDTLMADPKAHSELHANLVFTKQLKLKAQFWKQIMSSKQPQRPPSIFVLILDSTSRTQMYRSLPKTVDHLVHSLNFIDFKGHHAVERSRLINSIALLTGLRSRDSSKYHLERGEYWDSLPFIWNEFERLNYVTGYIEDLPRLSVFHSGGHRGHARKPTDLYLRPLMLAHDAVHPHVKKTICFGQRPVLKFMLDHQLLTLQRLRNIPSLLILHPSWPWQEYPRALQLHDDTFLKFLKKIDPEVLDNTWFVVTANNGQYKGTYATTMEGRIERQTIPLLIRPPLQALMQQPKLLNTLVRNSEIVTSHFDVYQLLLEVAKQNDPEGLVEGTEITGQSLTSPLPTNRTCEEAGIPKPMCACNLQVRYRKYKMHAGKNHRTLLAIRSARLAKHRRV